MKKVYIFLFLVFSGLNIKAQNSYVSQNSYAGIWTDNNSWVGEVAPPIQNITGNFQLYGYIRREGDLAFNNSARLIVRDTMFVTGDVALSNNTTIRVAPQGVMVVIGDFTGGEGTTLVNAGRVVIKGDINFGKNGTIINGNAAYIYDDSPKFGPGSSLTGNNVLNEQALAQRDAGLFEFVEGGGILPIELIFFKATDGTNHIRLEWATAMEENFDYFVIERSHDLSSFNVLDTIAGAGNSIVRRDYQYLDYAAKAGNTFYRLKSVDKDGSYKYSPFVTARNTDMSTKVYPNPSPGTYLTVQSYSASDNDLFKVRILNATGDIIYHTQLASGLHNLQFSRKLHNGFYIVEIDDGNMVTRKRLMVSN